MAAALQEILDCAEALLEPQRFRDYAHNGLQVAGPPSVRMIVTGVSAHLELFEHAALAGADLVLVHHGLFWGEGPHRVDAALKRRLKVLFDHELALAAYHLPLDAHPELGNNALLARALGLQLLRPFASHHGVPIGYLGEAPGEGIALDGDEGLTARVQHATGQIPLVLAEGPDRVRRLGIVTGAGTDFLPEAIDAGADAFITGEPAERALALAREGSINFLAAGHHATETFGIAKLGEHLSEAFGVEHRFIDIRNPI
jgi:dinuclear metal center YbgI/SA1388 family protein